ncbi:MAG TPA: nucleotidyltransferase family protein [Chitinophagaceae bacterium]|nr:nucleotidyltransferase family protein [Chitinophagaceae bacterium]
MNNFFEIDNCAVILLAAGASVRLGKPKQLLIYKGKSFLQNMISAAVNSHLNPVVVVLGAHSTLITGEITENNVHVAQNQDWEEGIASSIRCGIRALGEISPASDAAILMVCDQPHITSSLLNDLVDAQRKTGKPIVAAYYSGIAATPALFHKIFFPELLLLKGDKGAGKILRQQIDQVATVSFPLGAIDIDTISNYEMLRQDD